MCFIVPFDFYYQAEPNEYEQKHADPAAGPKLLFEMKRLFFRGGFFLVCFIVNFTFFFSIKANLSPFFHFRAIKRAELQNRINRARGNGSVWGRLAM